MDKKVISNERVPTKNEIKIVKSLSEGLSAEDIAMNTRLGMTERQVYRQIQLIKISYNCLNVPHLVATFLRSKIID